MAFSAAEISLMDEYAKSEEKKLRLIKNEKKPVIKKRKVSSLTAFFEIFIGLIIPLFIYGIFCVTLNAKSDSLTRDIEHKEEQIKSEESLQVKLQQEISSTISPQSIEIFASENNMVPVSPYQVSFVSLTEGDRVTYYRGAKKDLNKEKNKDILKEIRAFFEDISSKPYFDLIKGDD